MKKVSIWKKIRFYLTYRKLVKSIKNELKLQYNIRTDRVKRIYTVVNVPTDMFDEPYTMRTADINKISESYLTEYIRQISDVLNKKGLSELYKLYEVNKVDKYSYLIIIGFSLFDTSSLLKKIIFKVIPFTIAICVITYLFFHFSKTF